MNRASSFCRLPKFKNCISLLFGQRSDNFRHSGAENDSSERIHNMELRSCNSTVTKSRIVKKSINSPQFVKSSATLFDVIEVELHEHKMIVNQTKPDPLNLQQKVEPVLCSRIPFSGSLDRLKWSGSSTRSQRRISLWSVYFYFLSLPKITNPKTEQNCSTLEVGVL